MPLIKDPQNRAHKLNYLFPYSPILVPLGHIIIYLQLTTKKQGFFFWRKLVKRYPKWPMSDLTKVSSWTSRFGPDRFD
jgi:hypothetical protein